MINWLIVGGSSISALIHHFATYSNKMSPRHLSVPKIGWVLTKCQPVATSEFASIIFYTWVSQKFVRQKAGIKVELHTYESGRSWPTGSLNQHLCWAHGGPISKRTLQSQLFYWDLSTWNQVQFCVPGTCCTCLVAFSECFSPRLLLVLTSVCPLEVHLPVGHVTILLLWGFIILSPEVLSKKVMNLRKLLRLFKDN